MFAAKKRPTAMDPEVLARAEAKVETAKVAIVRDPRWKFFRPLLLSLKTQASTRNKSAWTDAVTLGWNPAFIDGLTHEQVIFVLLHEVMHPALGDNWRMHEFDDHKLANVAADKRINHELMLAGCELISGVHLAEGEEVGKSAEWIYWHLQEQKEQEQQEQEPEPGTDGQPGDEEEEKEEGDDEEQGDGDQPGDEEGDEPGDDEGDEDGEGSGDSDEEGDEGDSEGDGGAGDGDGDEEEGDGPGDEGDEEDGDGNPLDDDCKPAPEGADEDGNEATEEEWKHRVTQAAALGRGTMTGGTARLAEDAVRPKLDVRALLIQFLQERSKNDYSWQRPNQRYASQGLYLPALHDNQLGEVAIMVDTSASMSRHDLQKARGIIEDVIAECRPKALTVWYADANVARVDRFEQGEPLVWQPAGFGGTDFRPAFKQIEEEGEAVCIIAISDLDGDFPETEPSIPTVWLSTTLRDWRTGQYAQAPFGETYHIAD